MQQTVRSIRLLCNRTDLTVYNRAQEAASSALRDEHDEIEPPQPLNLIDQFIALLLAIFIESGILEVSSTQV
jgi:hypothetical protein